MASENKDQAVEHVQTHQWAERNSIWTQCSCGEKWSQSMSTTQETLDDLFRRHAKHFNDKTVVL